MGFESPEALAVYGYVDPMSVAQGEPLTVCCASRRSETAYVDVYRVVGCDPDFQLRLAFVWRSEAIAVERYPGFPEGVPLGPGDADLNGCGWSPVEVLAEVPETWPSGFYVAQFTTAPEPTGQPSARLGEDAFFVVRAAVPGSTSRVLVQLPVATWSAYHIWQNRSLYNADVGDPTGIENVELRAHKVSLRRPGLGFAPGNNVRRWLPKGRLYVPPFVQWLEAEGLTAEFCTGIDIDQGRIPLSAYELVASLGHDEYWGGAQRDALEAFVRDGGNLAFFAGNICYWQVRFEDDGTTVVCYKRTGDTHGPVGEPLDPRYRDPRFYPDHDNSDVTVEFWTEPLNRTTTTLSGVSMQWDAAARPEGFGGVNNGALWVWEDYGGPSRPPKGFTALDAGHWSLAGTGLAAGDEFGEEQKLVGYECDGLDVEWVDGTPVPTGRDGAIPGTAIVAYADCTTWGELDYSTEPPTRHDGRRLTPGATGGFVTLVCISTEGGGETFTASTTDWTHGLVPTVDYTDYRNVDRPVRPPSPVVQQITRNVLARLGGR
jgi:hypothetical protein